MEIISRQQTTIAAIATPLGEGALGIVRMSGPESVAVAQRVFEHVGGLSLETQKAQTLRRGWIVHNGQKIDEVMLALHRSPSSYTGEDTVEIIGHGGFISLRKVLKALLDAGAQIAEPGEFTKRAYLNGKMDLAQAEAVMDTIQAKSENALNAGLVRLRGGLSQWVHALREEILGFYAPLEAAIDFPEEGIESMTTQDLQSRLKDACEKLSSFLTASDGARLARNGINVTILGRPNAGKSSLFNALLLEKRALVSDIPGTTRDLLEETVTHKGFSITLTDTAGIRPSSRKLETQGISLALQRLAQSDVLLYVMDSSKPLHARDREFIESKLRNDNSILIFTKMDLPSRISQVQKKALADRIASVEVSAVAGKGLIELKDSIVRLMTDSMKDVSASECTVGANVRQTNLLQKAQEALRHAIRSCQEGQSYEMLAMDIAQTLQLLGEITGETATEELLHAIFSRFCVGK